MASRSGDGSYAQDLATGEQVAEGLFEYTYDAWGRLVREESSTTGLAINEYNGVHQRAHRKTGSTDWRYYYTFSLLVWKDRARVNWGLKCTNSPKDDPDEALASQECTTCRVNGGIRNAGNSTYRVLTRASNGWPEVQYQPLKRNSNSYCDHLWKSACKSPRNEYSAAILVGTTGLTDNAGPGGPTEERAAPTEEERRKACGG